MIPILFQTMTEGTVPTNYGIGPLTDCISCTVTEERNGSYELAMTYAVEGIHASEIEPNRFILAKPNYTDNPQIFRIYKVGKTINGSFTVNAQHISYDLSGKVISSGTASSAVAACALLQAKAGNFTINTDKTVSAAFSITAPSSVRSWFGGKEGSLLDIYGGEWKYDNYTASLKQARGSDRGVEIRYAKNLTQLSQMLDMSNLCTGVIPFYIDQDGNKTVGTKVSTGRTLDVDRDIAIDFSQDVDPESGTAISTQLANLANAYIANTNLTSITNSITLDFVQSGKLTERVDLCDTVHIYFEALGISAAAKCVKTVWNVLEERYTSTTFGDARTNICDTIASAQKQLQETPSTSFMAEAIAHATELITGNLGGYVILHDSDGNGEPDEILIMNTPDIATATQVWRWNKNGLGFATSYAGPYGTAITSDGKIVANYIATGTLDGTKATITNINASNINTGTLNADLIKAGTISDTGGNSTIDMTTGAATLNNLKAKNGFFLVDSGGTTRGYMSYNSAGGTSFIEYSQNGTQVAVVSGSTSDGGQLRLYNPSGTQRVNADGNNGIVNLYNASSKNALSLSNINNGGLVSVKDSDGTERAAIYTTTSKDGNLTIKNASGVEVVNLRKATSGGGSVAIKNSANDEIAQLYTNSNSAGYLLLKNSGGASNIYANGHSGNITCISLTQTSSRKVKENIKPIEDADKILELNAVSFDYKDKAQGANKRGFIAEDVAEVLPNLVTPETDDTPATLDYIGMIPYMQDVIKKQAAKIAELEERLTKLEG